MTLTASYDRMNDESILKFVKVSVYGLIDVGAEHLLAGMD